MKHILVNPMLQMEISMGQLLIKSHQIHYFLFLFLWIVLLAWIVAEIVRTKKILKRLNTENKKVRFYAEIVMRLCAIYLIVRCVKTWLQITIWTLQQGGCLDEWFLT